MGESKEAPLGIIMKQIERWTLTTSSGRFQDGLVLVRLGGEGASENGSQLYPRVRIDMCSVAPSNGRGRMKMFDQGRIG